VPPLSKPWRRPWSRTPSLSNTQSGTVQESRLELCEILKFCSFLQTEMCKQCLQTVSASVGLGPQPYVWAIDLQMKVPDAVTHRHARTMLYCIINSWENVSMQLLFVLQWDKPASSKHTR